MALVKHIRTVGRRKEASAQVSIKSGKGEILINSKPYQEYFPYFEYQQQVVEPLKVAGRVDSSFVMVVVRGGGIRGQAEAVRLGIARALVKDNPDLRASLRAAGLLTCDPRVKERKKYGLKRARRAPQWQKR